jgi:hypothetical protein
MTSLHDPLTLPNGQVLPNRIMKASMNLNRGRIATTVALVRRNGRMSIGRKRGLA